MQAKSFLVNSISCYQIPYMKCNDPSCINIYGYKDIDTLKMNCIHKRELRRYQSRLFRDDVYYSRWCWSFSLDFSPVLQESRQFRIGNVVLLQATKLLNTFQDRKD